ncbi:hypothetical protein HYH02_003462 [Chlamydomonas schloesseri]|uniref:N-acetyltransferase domain-containing protein n=1 Tax=Chlamydomonas schloesseri TaxID=2026947 RepID=A0A835WQL6_9CHLO|nr:hypothetical protein HYH02_003462 [Chlamydomonas schloesseri]|eukprot:KAG2451682.1 hypothetical protein HYH02_003462 [Chlamydomonas schloesseri]
MAFPSPGQHGARRQQCRLNSGRGPYAPPGEQRPFQLARTAAGWRLQQQRPSQPRQLLVASAARSPQQPAPLPPRVSCGEGGGAPLHIRAAELRDYWPAADLHTRVFSPDTESDQGKALSMRVDRIIALQINDRIAREGGGNSVLLLAFDGEAPCTPEERAAAEAAFAAAVQAAQTPGSPSHVPTSFPNPMWWLARPLGPGVRASLGVTAESVGLVGVAAVDSFCDLVPARELDPRRDGAFGWYRRDGYAYVSNVAVLPTARRRGVARQLMAAAEALAAEWGCKAVGLHCNPKKTAPWSLYSGLGYRNSGVVEPWCMPYLQGRPPDRCSFLVKRVSGYPGPKPAEEGAAAGAAARPGSKEGEKHLGW